MARFKKEGKWLDIKKGNVFEFCTGATRFFFVTGDIPSTPTIVPCLAVSFPALNCSRFDGRDDIPVFLDEAHLGA